MLGTPHRLLTSAPLRAALAAGAAVAVLTGCGGGSGTSAASGSSSAPPPTSTSAAPPSASAAAAGSDFCTQARAFADAAGSVAGRTDGTDVAAQLQTLVAQLRSIDPPPAIASDRQSSVTSLQQLARAYQGVDLSDPQQVAQLEQRLAPLTQQLSTSGQRVDSYLQTQCGISLGDTSETAAPSS
jgi:hypothetical protein